MSHSPHVERHFTASDTVRDIVIGMADGLTVPFALAAGVSGANIASRIVLTAGMAEIAAGSIAMGLGGFLAARSDAEHYASERIREQHEVVEKPEAETEEVADVFKAYGLSQTEIEPILQAFKRKPEAWVNFMMRFELGLEEPSPRRAWISALTIGGAYIAGGIIPLSPYFFFENTHTGLEVSALVTFVALMVFGAIKGQFTGTKALRGAMQTTCIGGLAALTAFLMARLIS